MLVLNLKYLRKMTLSTVKIMKNYLKNIFCFLAIWGVETAIVLFCIDLLLPSEAEQFSYSVGYGHADSISPTATENTSQSRPNYPTLASLPLFLPGTTQAQILARLGEPTWRKPGYWDNSVAWSYENLLALKIDVGFLFDTKTKKLRQVEIALPSSIKIEHLYKILDDLFEYTPASIERSLEAVYSRKTDSQKFRIDNLEAVIRRNDSDRLYIAVWEEDFH